MKIQFKYRSHVHHGHCAPEVDPLGHWEGDTALPGVVDVNVDPAVVGVLGDVDDDVTEALRLHLHHVQLHL